MAKQSKQFDYSTLPSANVANYNQMKGVGRYFSELKGNTNGSSSFWKDARVFTAIIYKQHKTKPVTNGQIQTWRSAKKIPSEILKAVSVKKPKQLTAKAKPSKNLNNITKDQLVQMVIALQEQQQSK